ncbi:hypothetical protein U1Q18_046101 [Sarracenia purpurea var. burkii]
MASVENATFTYVLQLLREIEKERDVIIKDRQAVMALAVRDRRGKENSDRKQCPRERRDREGRRYHEESHRRESLDRNRKRHYKEREQDRKRHCGESRKESHSRRVCYKCNKEGHQMENCPEIKCFNCQGLGHIGKNCKKPKSIATAHYAEKKDHGGDEASYTASSDGKFFGVVLDSGASEAFL